MIIRHFFLLTFCFLSLTGLPFDETVYAQRVGINNKKIASQQEVNGEVPQNNAINNVVAKNQNQDQTSYQPVHQQAVHVVETKKISNVVIEKMAMTEVPAEEKTDKKINALTRGQATGQNLSNNNNSSQEKSLKNNWQRLIDLSRLESLSTVAAVVRAKTFQVPLPQVTKGLYLTAASALDAKKLKFFVEQSKQHNLNTLVIDIQPKVLPAKSLDYIRSEGIFPVARLVVFDGGLKTAVASPKHLDSIYRLMLEAALAGFHEVQLDYIRYSDSKEMQRLPLKDKYKHINDILDKAAQLAQKAGIFLSADVFGRITLNQNDQIGQKLENFAQYMQTIYPMVYPSHYYGDDRRTNDPYFTVKEGVEKSKQRLAQTRIVAYIQGFGMKVKQSGLSLVDYIVAQIRACDDAKTEGYIVWNPRNDYRDTFSAITKFEKQRQDKKLVAEK